MVTTLALLEPLFEDEPMARAYIEAPYGWGDTRVIRVAWERAGYSVEELRTFGMGPNRLMISANAKARPLGPGFGVTSGAADQRDTR